MRKMTVVFFMLFGVATLFGYADEQTQERSPVEKIRDTIVVHGTVLRGRLIDIGPEKLSFRPRYSEGTVRIAYADIDSINTKFSYHISFKRIEIVGRIIGIEDASYLKVLEGNKERTIKISDIDNFVTSVGDDDSIENVLHNNFPYTKGSVYVGFEVEDGVNSKNKADALMDFKRKVAEHEVRFLVDYEYEVTQSEDEPEVQKKDELYSTVAYKNYFQNEQFFYAGMLVEYDRPRQIDWRWLPSVGYGYRFELNKSRWLEPSIGLGYASTSYTDGEYPDDTFTAAALGLSGEYLFDDVAYINSVILDGAIRYFPSLAEPDTHWIMRSNVGAKIPLLDFLSVRFSVDYIDDSSPDPKVGKNKTTSKLLFGLDF